MWKGIKQELYKRKRQILFKKGISEGKIIPFNEEIYKQMEHTYIGGVPMSFYIKYFKPTRPPGNCYERSLGMFFCFEDAILVRSNTKYLEIEYGKEEAGHGWIEIGNYVYDASLLMRIDKELYYQMYEPYDVVKITKEEYLEIPIQQEVYNHITETKLEEYKPHGKKRFELLTNIPILIGIAERTHDNEYIADLYNYLELINYDEESIREEIKQKLRKNTKKNKMLQ